MQRIYDAVLKASNGNSPMEAREGAMAALVEAAAIMREYAGRRPANRPAELAEMQPAWLRACADILDGWSSLVEGDEPAPAPLPEREPGAALAANPAPEPEPVSEFGDPADIDEPDEQVPAAAIAYAAGLFGDPAPVDEPEGPPPFSLAPNEEGWTPPPVW